MRDWIIIAYRQYGEWSVTRPWKDMAAAQAHSKRQLEDNTIRNVKDGSILSMNSNAHIVDITYITIQLPE